MIYCDAHLSFCCSSGKITKNSNLRNTNINISLKSTPSSPHVELHHMIEHLTVVGGTQPHLRPCPPGKNWTKPVSNPIHREPGSEKQGRSADFFCSTNACDGWRVGIPDECEASADQNPTAIALISKLNIEFIYIYIFI